MEAKELPAFADYIVNVASQYAKAITADEIREMFGQFPDHSFASVKRAIEAHRADPRSNRFFPRVVDIQAKLPSGGDSAVEGAKQSQCEWNADRIRCTYPAFSFNGGRAFCAMHRHTHDQSVGAAIAERSRDIPYRDALAQWIEESTREEARKLLAGRRWNAADAEAFLATVKRYAKGKKAWAYQIARDFIAGNYCSRAGIKAAEEAVGFPFVPESIQEIHNREALAASVEGGRAAA